MLKCFVLTIGVQVCWLRAGPLEASGALLKTLPRVPTLATLGLLPVHQQKALVAKREPLLQALERVIPIAPREASIRFSNRESLLGLGQDRIPEEQVLALAEELRFLARFELLQGQPEKACEYLFRILQLGVDLSRTAPNPGSVARGLALETLAYIELAQALLAGGYNTESIQRFGGYLAEAFSLLPLKERRTRSVRRGAQVFFRQLRNKVAQGKISAALEAEAKEAFGRHAKALMAYSKNRSYRDFDAYVQTLSRSLLKRSGKVLAPLGEVPLFQGLGEAVARLETSQLFALASLDLATYRLKKGLWPSKQPSALRDPMSKGALSYRLGEEGPVLWSTGPDGRQNGGFWPEDWIVMDPASSLALSRVKQYVGAFRIQDLSRLDKVYTQPTPIRRKAPAGTRCQSIRDALDAATLRAQAKHQIEFLDRGREVLSFLEVENYAPPYPRCPEQGFLAMAGGRWVCSQHRTGYDPRPRYEVEVVLRQVCHARRFQVATRIQAYQQEKDRDMRSARKHFLRELLSSGYLTQKEACPDADGEWHLTQSGLVCSRHLPVVRVKPLAKF